MLCVGAKNNQINHPDYVPSLLLNQSSSKNHIGTSPHRQRAASTSMGRYDRGKKRSLSKSETNIIFILHDYKDYQ